MDRMIVDRTLMHVPFLLSFPPRMRIDSLLVLMLPRCRRATPPCRRHAAPGRHRRL